MKKILVVMFLISIFSSCSFDMLQDNYNKARIGYQKLFYHPDFDSLDTYAKIGRYIQQRVKYDYEDDLKDIKNPYDTLASGKGSCADYAILFMNIAYYGMGIKMNYAQVHTDDRAIVAGGRLNHAVVSYQDIIIEPQRGYRVDYVIKYIYTFDEVFSY